MAAAGTALARNFFPNSEFSGCQKASDRYLPLSHAEIHRTQQNKKAAAKRFKITGTGKVLRRKSSKRHLLGSKSSKRKRKLGKVALVDDSDLGRIRAALPFG